MRRLALALSGAGTAAVVVGFLLLPGALGLSAGGTTFRIRGALQAFDASMIPTSTYAVGTFLAVLAVAVLQWAARRRDSWLTFIGALTLSGAVFVLVVAGNEVVRVVDFPVSGIVGVPVRGRSWLDAGTVLLECAAVAWAAVGVRAARRSGRPQRAVAAAS